MIVFFPNLRRPRCCKKTKFLARPQPTPHAHVRPHAPLCEVCLCFLLSLRSSQESVCDVKKKSPLSLCLPAPLLPARRRAPQRTSVVLCITRVGFVRETPTLRICDAPTCCNKKKLFFSCLATYRHHRRVAPRPTSSFRTYRHHRRVETRTAITAVWRPCEV